MKTRSSRARGGSRQGDGRSRDSSSPRRGPLEWRLATDEVIWIPGGSALHRTDTESKAQ